MKNNLYEILEISPDANSEEIKRSYKRLALKYHPDKNKDPNAAEVFNKIKVAYDTLIDPVRRSSYDSVGNFENKEKIEDAFMNFHKILQDLCDKYGVPEEERRELYEMFDVEEINRDIQNGDCENSMNAIYNRMTKFILKKSIEAISNKNKYVGSCMKYMWSFFE